MDIKKQQEYRDNLRKSIYFSELERIKKRSKQKPRRKHLRRRITSTDPNNLLLMVATDQDSLKSAELNLFRTNLRNQIFLKKYIANKVTKDKEPRLSMPEVTAIKEKIKRIKRKLKKRIFNNQKILPGVKESIRDLEVKQKHQRNVEFGITNSSFFNSERVFDGSILSKDSFFHNYGEKSDLKDEILKPRISSLKRNTTRKHVYRLLKSRYGAKYLRVRNNEKKMVLRRREGPGDKMKKRKNLAQSFY